MSKLQDLVESMHSALLSDHKVEETWNDLRSECNRIHAKAEEAKYSLLHYKHMETDAKHFDYAVECLESIVSDSFRSSEVEP